MLFPINAIYTHIIVNIDFNSDLDVVKGKTHWMGNQNRKFYIVPFCSSNNNHALCVSPSNRFWIFVLNPCKDSKENIEVSVFKVILRDMKILFPLVSP